LDPLGNVGHSAVTDPAPASNGGDYSPTSAPAMDPQSGSLSCYDVTFDMNWDFKTMTARDAVVASIRIMVCFIFIIGCFAPFFPSFYEID
jgi:hypothetical protein